MVKTLIVEDNIQYCKYIINFITSFSNNIQVSYIANDVEEALTILANNKIDLILLDLKIPKISGLDILKELKENKCYNNPRVFLLSKDTKLLYEASLNSLVESYSNKMEPAKVIYNKIQKVANNIEKNIYSERIDIKFQRELSALGFNFKYKGTQYLLDAIKYIYFSDEIDLLDNLEKYVYKVIANQNNKSLYNIKTNMTKACDLAYLYQEKHVIKKYFLMELKPTPKVVISTILMKYMNK